MSAEPEGDRYGRSGLVEARRRAGLSQEDLADKIGASRSSVYRWERGPDRPQPRQIRPWAAAIGVSAEDLFDILWSGDDVVGMDRPERQSHNQTIETIETRRDLEGAEVPAELVPSPNSAGRESLRFEESVVTLLGLQGLLAGPRPLPPVVLALSSFRGSDSIRTVQVSEQQDVPTSYVQGQDDISNDVFFGKRDTMLANQISAALSRVGFRHPLYVEDRIVWDALARGAAGSDAPPTIRQYGEEHPIGVLIVVGLWSNLLATGLADWSAFPEFQMAGDPANHATRTIRICGPEGLRVIDLNASPESDELGGNPAIIVARKLANVHTIVVGGATSLSTLRLAELLAKDGTWRDLAGQAHPETEDGPGTGGAWIAIECPNAAQWKDRCRIVGADRIQRPVSDNLSSIRRTTS